MIGSFGSIALLLALGAQLRAQDISSNVSAQIISAKPGMVNYVEGKPLVFRDDPAEGTKLVARNQLTPGESVQTNEGDRAEILLSPGSYLRVAGNSRLDVVKAEFDDMQFKLDRGTAILESASFDKKVHALKVSTPAGEVRVLEKGLYRFQVVADREVEVFVYSGKAEWLKGEKVVASLKPKKRYMLGSDQNGQPQFVKLGKNDLDATDMWSQKRAEYLVAANDRLSDWMLGSSYYGAGYGYRGGWIFNPFFNAFTFLPFGDFGFYSPYGYSYGYYYPYYNYYGRGVGTGGGTSSGSTASTGSASAGTSKPKNSTVLQRSSVSRASSAPSVRMSSGRSEQVSRGSVHTSSPSRSK
jgi:hypothetical protein